MGVAHVRDQLAASACLMMVLMPFAPASVVFALPSAAVHFARLLFFTEIQLHVGAARAAAQFRLRWVVAAPADRRVLLRKR